MIRSFVALCFFAFTFGCGPIVMIPGGPLEGSPAAVPTDWSFSDAVDTVQLETNPGDPYSVNVWGVAVGQAFYVAAGDRDSEWAQNMNRDPKVRLKIEEAVYELRAVQVEDEAELGRFLAAAKAKYDFEPDEEQRGGAQLYRLEAR